MYLPKAFRKVAMDRVTEIAATQSPFLLIFKNPGKFRTGPAKPGWWAPGSREFPVYLKIEYAALNNLHVALWSELEPMVVTEMQRLGWDSS
jgi:hypothetical protein